MKLSDIQWQEAGPDDPIFKGGLRMNAVQKPAKSTARPQNSSDRDFPAEPNSVLPPEAAAQVSQEAKEQMGFQPEADEFDSTNNGN